MSLRIMLLAFVLSVACKGADGATGPQGPTGQQGVAGPVGPIGPAGAGNRVTFAGTIAANGTGFADLPAAAGTLSNPPAFACYLLFTISGTPAWLVVGDAGPASGAVCGVGLTPGASTLRVVLSGAVSGQSYAIVVVY